MQIREKEIQLQKEIKERELEARIFTEKEKLQNFDVTKYIRFVPPFNEKEVDKYFLLFEKVANDIDWPLNKYTILLQSVLKGKASEVYLAPVYQDSMPVHQDFTPVHQDSTPVFQDITPACQDSMPVCQDSTPVYQDSTPVFRITCLFVRISCLLLRIFPLPNTSDAVSEVYKPFFFFIRFSFLIT